jgi:hypothetical protein
MLFKSTLFRRRKRDRMVVLLLKGEKRMKRAKTSKMFGLPRVRAEDTAREEVFLEEVCFEVSRELDALGAEGVGHEGLDGGQVGGGVEDHVLVGRLLLDPHLVCKALAEGRLAVLVVHVQRREVVCTVRLLL